MTFVQFFDIKKINCQNSNQNFNIVSSRNYARSTGIKSEII